MRRTLQGLALAATAVAATLVGAAAPAHAAVVRCGPPQILHRDTISLPVEVVTCAEADGALRRGTTTLINLANRPVPILDLRTLISQPDYGDKDCGSVVLGPAGTPSATATCVSPWVVDRIPVNQATVFSLLQALSLDGQFISDIPNFHTAL